MKVMRSRLKSIPAGTVVVSVYPDFEGRDRQEVIRRLFEAQKSAWRSHSLRYTGSASAGINGYRFEASGESAVKAFLALLGPQFPADVMVKQPN